MSRKYRAGRPQPSRGGTPARRRASATWARCRATPSSAPTCPGKADGDGQGTPPGPGEPPVGGWGAAGDQAEGRQPARSAGRRGDHAHQQAASSTPPRDRRRPAPGSGRHDAEARADHAGATDENAEQHRAGGLRPGQEEAGTAAPTRASRRRQRVDRNRNRSRPERAGPRGPLLAAGEGSVSRPGTEEARRASPDVKPPVSRRRRRWDRGFSASGRTPIGQCRVWTPRGRRASTTAPPRGGAPGGGTLARSQRGRRPGRGAGGTPLLPVVVEEDLQGGQDRGESVQERRGIREGGVDAKIASSGSAWSGGGQVDSSEAGSSSRHDRECPPRESLHVGVVEQNIWPGR